jgi:hypothetical protein
MWCAGWSSCGRRSRRAPRRPDERGERPECEDRVKRVVVTGMGCVTPIGNSVAEFREALYAGRSGIAAFDTNFAGCADGRSGAAIQDDGEGEGVRCDAVLFFGGDCVGRLQRAVRGGGGAAGGTGERADGTPRCCGDCDHYGMRVRRAGGGRGGEPASLYAQRAGASDGDCAHDGERGREQHCDRPGDWRAGAESGDGVRVGHACHRAGVPDGARGDGAGGDCGRI